MADDRRWTKFPPAGQIGRTLPPPGKPKERDGVSEGTTTPRKLKRRRPEPPARLPFPLLLHAENSRPEPKRTHLEFCKQGKPWAVYRFFLSDNEAGPVVIAHEQQFGFRMVAIKERVLTEPMRTNKLIRIEHPHIVHLLDAYSDSGMIYLVYESVPVSLRDMQTCPYGPWTEYELSAICQQTLEGVIYIQSQLNSAIPLQAKHVLVDDHGMVKIANVGEVLLISQPPQSHCRELGRLLLDLMEPGSCVKGKDTPQLRLPQWQDDIREFLHLSQTQSPMILQAHAFLKVSPGPGCLKPYVETVKRGRSTLRSEI